MTHEPTTKTKLQAPDLDRHLKNVAGFSMFVMAHFPLSLDSGGTVQHIFFKIQITE